jgi:hypothetical protein
MKKKTIAMLMQIGTVVSFNKHLNRFKKRTIKNIVEVNAKGIDAFKETMEEASLRIKAMSSEEVAIFKHERRNLKKKLDEYGDEVQGKWREFKRNIKHDSHGIGKTIKVLFKHNH